MKNKQRNPVAKFAKEFNRCKVMENRKKLQQRGYSKHKKSPVQGSFVIALFI